MEHSRLQQFRTLLIGLATVGVVPRASFVAKSFRSACTYGTSCFAPERVPSGMLTCMTALIPSEQSEAPAAQFKASLGPLTAHLVPKRCANASNVVRRTRDPSAARVTWLKLLVPLRLGRGPHPLTPSKSERSAFNGIAPESGGVDFVDRVGAVCARGGSHRQDIGTPDSCPWASHLLMANNANRAEVAR